MIAYLELAMKILWNLLPTVVLLAAVGFLTYMNMSTMDLVYMQKAQLVKENAPASNWLTVENVTIPSFHMGEDPTILVERTIHQGFYGVWAVDFEQVTDSGVIYTCGFQGRADYSTNALLPNPLHLSWWVYEKNNPLSNCMEKAKTGNYRLCTTWRIYPEGYPEKRVKTCSNIFEVLPARSARG